MNSMAVTNSSRSTDSIVQVVYVAIPARIAGIVPRNVLPDPRLNDCHATGDPLKPMERCAQLCRWLS
jgi:hypothetical protein